MKRFIVIMVLGARVGSLLAQCVEAQFSISNNDKICRNSSVLLMNETTGGTTYYWDFCPEDFTETPVNANSTITGFANGYGYKIIQDNGQWHGFLVSRSLNKLFRLDFGNNPASSPIVVDLGNPGGMMVAPEGIDFYKEGNQWYAFVGKGENGTGQVVRFEFGSSLSNTPTATGFGTFGLGSIRIRDLMITRQGDDIILLLLVYNTNSINRVNFGNSLLNTPATNNLVTIAGASLPVGFTIAKNCNPWVLHIASTNGLVQQVSFGSNILGPATVQGTYSFPSSVIQPWKIRSIFSNGKFFSVISNNNSRYVVLDFGDLSLASPPQEVASGNDVRFIAMDVFQFQGQIVLQGAGGSTSLFSVYYNKPCNASTGYSTAETPNTFSFSGSGSFPVYMKASDLYNRKDYAFRMITVSSNDAPSVTITHDNFCKDSPVTFGANSSTAISTWNWDLGDNATSSISNPVHQYSQANTYSVTAEVIDINNCFVQAQYNLEIFNPPIASFTLPSANPFCTNQSYVSNNTSVYDAGSSPYWQWQINGANTSTNKNFDFAFTSTSSQEIKLTATIPGCQSEASETINLIEEGPLADFIVDGHCIGEQISFTNNSGGSVTEYSWNFGDSETSSEIDPVHVYSSFGNFDVTLTTISPSGCNNFTTKPITIYSKPQPNFLLALPPFSCSGTTSQFTDTTPGPPDSNLTTWQWNFGNEGSPQNTSTLRNPQHTYMNAGNYDVTLTAGTNYGCQGTIQKQVIIAQTPVIEIVNTPACKDQPVTFTANSQEPLKSWNWQTGIVQYTTAQPTHLYTTTGTFAMNLNAVGENDCITSASKNIVIPQPLVPDFIVEKNCVGQEAIFSDATTVFSDPIAAWNWNFAGLGSGTGSPATHTFQSTGEQSVALQITTASGCVYTASKNVVVVNAPQANFVANPEVGVPPLSVQFTNSSTNATHYLWNFNDPGQTTSTQASPQFTFNEFGNHVVDLTAYNAQNCSHTFTKVIRAELPVVEIQLLDLVLAENPAGTLMVEVVIRNNGNSAVQNLPLSIDLSGITVLQIVPDLIVPNATVSHLLSFNVLKGTKLEYICVRADIAHDIVPENNVLCKPTESGTVVFAPHPNPAKDLVQIDWIAEENQATTIGIHDALGRTFTNYTTPSNAGFNSSPLNVSSLDPGVYFIVFQSGGIRRSYRVLVWR